MRTYISPIGYDSRRVTRPILSNGLDEGDQIILLRPNTENDDQRARSAIRDVTDLLEEIEPDVQFDKEEITYDDLSSAALECSDILQAADGDLVVALTGGAREILIPFALASFIHAPRIHQTLTFSDVDQRVREWSLPVLQAHVPRKAHQTLAVIAEADAPLSMSDLTEQIEQSKSTATRHVETLAENEVVTTFRDGKTKYAEITFTGELLLRAGA
ncbi:helix-turn-helix domain-containing protein [Haladaptatus cibarius]|uniref:helix-turn-helix domain-containing protein n=1 Tax=Haladaptatus cibarius TaxID=453847 RepID=UPI000679C0C8|nr:helix-turn-helix domain-containing protein [Haladaptatus cibarius]